MENEWNSKSVLRNLRWDRASTAGASKVKSLLKCLAVDARAKVCVAFLFLPLELQAGTAPEGLSGQSSCSTPADFLGSETGTALLNATLVEKSSLVFWGRGNCCDLMQPKGILIPCNPRAS